MKWNQGDWILLMVDGRKEDMLEAGFQQWLLQWDSGSYVLHKWPSS
jgi:hypothetical protein